LGFRARGSLSTFGVRRIAGAEVSDICTKVENSLIGEDLLYEGSLQVVVRYSIGRMAPLHLWRTIP
jgi:hypothetical protein